MPRIWAQIANLGRRPSLRGHRVHKCIHREKSFTVYSAIERSTALEKTVLLPRVRSSSIAALFAMLQQSDLDFAALRLRDGNVCCVAEGPSSPNLPSQGLSESKSLRSPRRPRRLIVTLAALVSFLAASMVTSGLPEAHDNTSKPSPVGSPTISKTSKPIDCNEKMNSSRSEISAFLEKGSHSSNLDFVVNSILQNGGLRSVDVTVVCHRDLEDQSEPKEQQSWRVWLSKSELIWTVIKMTQLEN
jgi:hypothetical protein